jgi:hypothetical protein
MPIMDTSRARSELGWSPARSSLDALDSFFAGLRQPSGGVTPPLDPDTSGPARVREVTARVGGAEVR